MVECPQIHLSTPSGINERHRHWVQGGGCAVVMERERESKSFETSFHVGVIAKA